MEKMENKTQTKIISAFFDYIAKECNLEGGSRLCIEEMFAENRSAALYGDVTSKLKEKKVIEGKSIRLIQNGIVSKDLRNLFEEWKAKQN